MNLSKLNQNEKLAVYGSVAAIVGPVLASAGFGFGAGGLTLILALAMLAIVFLPQLSPQTQLPGSKGSLMVIVGGVAAISAALALLSSLGLLGLLGNNLIFVVGWLIGIAGGLLMGWAGWQEFQSEGGQLRLGGKSATTNAPPPESTQAPTPSAPAAPSETSAPAAPAADVDATDDEGRPTNPG